MRLDGSDQLSRDRRAIVNDEGIAGPQHRPPRGSKQSVAAPIACRQWQIVEGRAIGFDHDPLLDKQIDPAHSAKRYLRSHPEPEVEGEQPHDRLEPRFGTPIRGPQLPPRTGSEPGCEPRPVRRPQKPQVKRAVDARHPLVGIETLTRLDERVDQRHMIPVTQRLGKWAPVTAVATGILPQARRVSREVHVDALGIQHPHSPVPQLRHAGEAATHPHGAARELVDPPFREMPGPDAGQPPIADGPRDPPVCPSGLEELLPRHVHGRSLGPSLFGWRGPTSPGGRERPHKIQEEQPFRPL